MTTPQPPEPPRPEAPSPPSGRPARRWLPWALTVIAFVFGFVLGGVAFSGDSSDAPAYDDGAHRAAIEAHLGHPVDDWPTYVDLLREDCRKDGFEFDIQLALNQDGGTYDRLLTSIRHLCPERMADVVRYEQEAAR